MKPSIKMLSVVWASSVLTFTAMAVYMLPRQESIKAPGELGENFAGIGLLLFCALLLISAGILIFSRKN
jgi:hypothetical protein